MVALDAYNRKDQIEEKLLDIKNASHLKDILDKNFTSSDRLQVLSKILKTLGWCEEATQLNQYIEKVVPKRNILAHHRVVVDGFSRRLYDKKHKEFTNDDIRSLRQELLDHQENFESLSQKLNSLEPNEE